MRISHEQVEAVVSNGLRTVDVLQLLPRPYELIRADSQYFFDNFDSLKKLYPDEFIVILNAEVVAHHPDLDGLRAQLAQKGLQPGSGYVAEFVEATPRNLRL